MTEEIKNQEVIETPEPVVETPVAETPAPAPEPEFVYEYQPVDDLGRKLGNKQVFKGKSMQEVLDKVANANRELIKLNRDLKKNLRLGVYEQEEIPEEAPKYVDEEIAFGQPRQLTDEERFQLSRDLLDPDKFDEAADKLLEAKIGAKPQAITSALQKTQEEVEALKAKAAAEAFVKVTPQYFQCQENSETILNWMVKNGLKPTQQNFRLAYDKLSAVGLLLEAPIVREEQPVQAPVVEVPVGETPVNSQPEPEPDSRITVSEPQSQTKRSAKAASGFTRDSASDVGATSKSTKLSVKDIERMSATEYKRRLLTDRNFAKEVDEAYAAEGKRQ